MPKIKYIGQKAEKSDNVANTGVIWRGHGDVQEVPANVVNKLLHHSGIWQLAEDEALSETDVDNTGKQITEDKSSEALSETDVDNKAPLANLESMDATGLREYAQRNFGHTFHPRTGEERMRQDIIGLMNRG